MEINENYDEWVRVYDIVEEKKYNKELIKTKFRYKFDQ